MDDESRKRLTKYLDECDGCGKIKEVRDRQCGDNPCRFFVTWDDLGALKEKIAEKGEWDEFEDFALRTKNTPVVSMISLPQWLFTMPRFAELVDEFLKEVRS